MEINIWQLVASIIVALIASSPGLLTWWRGKKKNNIELAERYESMATRQAEKIDKQAKRIAEMQKEINALRERVEHLEDGVKILTAQLVSEGHDPKWPQPPEKGQL